MLPRDRHAATALRSIVTPSLASTIERLAPELELLAAGHHGDPGRVLGCRQEGARSVVVVCLPGAVRARLHGRRDLVRFGSSALFVWAGRAENLPAHYRLAWEDAAGGLHAGFDP